MKKPLISFPGIIHSAAVLLISGSGLVQAADYTWDGTNNASWADARWSSGTNSGINWVNGSSNSGFVNSGDVWSPIGITANSLTVGDGVGSANSASARFATNNAFRGINSITINKDGYLGGSAEYHHPPPHRQPQRRQSGGSDNGGDAAIME